MTSVSHDILHLLLYISKQRYRKNRHAQIQKSAKVIQDTIRTSKAEQNTGNMGNARRFGHGTHKGKLTPGKLEGVWMSLYISFLIRLNTKHQCVIWLPHT